MTHFNPTATRFYRNNAVSLAKAADLAYKQPDDPELLKELSILGFEQEAQIQYFDQEGTQGFIAAREDIIVISFRGTELNKLKDLMTDANIFLETRKDFGGRIHKGFNEGFTIVQNELLSQLKSVWKNQPIFLTGHSLGGALATLATAYLTYQGCPVQGLYTFGSPHVGDREFTKAFDQNNSTHIVRFVNDKDLVARIAPRFLGYRHISSPQILRGLDGVKAVNAMATEVPKVIQENAKTLGNLRKDYSLKGRTWNQIALFAADVMSKLFEMVEDHYMDSYIELIGKLPDLDAKTRKSAKPIPTYKQQITHFSQESAA